jgi:hypothetical protein
MAHLYFVRNNPNLCAYKVELSNVKYQSSVIRKLVNVNRTLQPRRKPRIYKVALSKRLY